MAKSPIEKARERAAHQDSAFHERLKEQERFYTSIGRALTAWSATEDALCHVFCRAMGLGSSTVSEKAYWAVVSFEARLKMTNRVVTTRCEDEPQLLEQWEAVVKFVRDQNEVRNKIAHGSVILFPYTNRKQQTQKIDVFFAPYFWSKSREHFRKVKPTNDGFLDGRPKDRFYINDIDAHSAQFHKAKSDLMGFSGALLFAMREQARR